MLQAGQTISVCMNFIIHNAHAPYSLDHTQLHLTVWVWAEMLALASQVWISAEVASNSCRIDP